MLTIGTFTFYLDFDTDTESFAWLIEAIDWEGGNFWGGLLTGGFPGGATGFRTSNYSSTTKGLESSFFIWITVYAKSLSLLRPWVLNKFLLMPTIFEGVYSVYSL